MNIDEKILEMIFLKDVTFNLIFHIKSIELYPYVHKYFTDHEYFGEIGHRYFYGANYIYKIVNHTEVEGAVREIESTQSTKLFELRDVLDTVFGKTIAEIYNKNVVVAKFNEYENEIPYVLREKDFDSTSRIMTLHLHPADPYEHGMYYSKNENYEEMFNECQQEMEQKIKEAREEDEEFINNFRKQQDEIEANFKKEQRKLYHQFGFWKRFLGGEKLKEKHFIKK